MPSVPSGLVAAASLVAGFAVAELTDVRALGGVVLGLGVAVCWAQWRRNGTWLALGLGLAYLAGFAAAHPLGREIGAWPSVLLVAAAVGSLSWAVADRRRDDTDAGRDTDDPTRPHAPAGPGR